MSELGQVEVLLSTFDGARYLEELLESLLQQDYGEISIRIRDDGSADDTVAVVQRCVEKSRIPIHFAQGSHLGPTLSFLTLLSESAVEARFWAFCDQDDVWLPLKLSRAVRCLDRVSDAVPAVYGSRLQIVDEGNRLIGLSTLPHRPLGFQNALVESRLPGCTMVLNRAARNLLISELPRFAICHDWWAYLVVSAVGTVVYDAEPTIRYRQHSQNVYGVEVGAWAALRAKLRFFAEDPTYRPATRQAAELQRIFAPQLNSRNAALLGQFLAPRQDFRARWSYACSDGVFRQSPRDQVALKGRILLDRV